MTNCSDCIYLGISGSGRLYIGDVPTQTILTESDSVSICLASNLQEEEDKMRVPEEIKRIDLTEVFPTHVGVNRASQDVPEARSAYSPHTWG